MQPPGLFMEGSMLHHYITQYGEDGKVYTEAWMQFNIFGLCFCFSRRRMEVHDVRNYYT
jgi:hypothetical protein